jgi:hypothetical protein
MVILDTWAFVAFPDGLHTLPLLIHCQTVPPLLCTLPSKPLPRPSNPALQTTVVRTLLKGHPAAVVDMAFAARTFNVLASLGVDGSFLVWELAEETGPEGDR